jgi:hypothetical protein
MTPGVRAKAMSAAFEKFGGISAILAGIAGFLYAVAFVIVSRYAPSSGRLLSALFLTLGSLLSTASFVAVYQWLKESHESFALWALLLGTVGAMGAGIHGGYDLANAIHPVPASAGDLPSQIDPRGLLTFGITGISVVIFAWLMRLDGRFPKGLGSLGYVFGALLVLLYLGRLIVLNATSPMIVVPALLSGFVVGPLWNVRLGLTLLRGCKA